MDTHNVSVNNRLGSLENLKVLYNWLLEEDRVLLVVLLGFNLDDVESLVVSVVVVLPGDDWSSHFGGSISSSNIKLESGLLVNQVNKSLEVLVLSSVLDDLPELSLVLFVRILNLDFVSPTTAGNLRSLAQISTSFHTSDSVHIAVLALSQESEPFGTVVTFLVRLEHVVSLVFPSLSGHSLSRMQSLQAVNTVVVNFVSVDNLFFLDWLLSWFGFHIFDMNNVHCLVTVVMSVMPSNEFGIVVLLSVEHIKLIVIFGILEVIKTLELFVFALVFHNIPKLIFSIFIGFSCHNVESFSAHN